MEGACGYSARPPTRKPPSRLAADLRPPPRTPQRRPPFVPPLPNLKTDEGGMGGSRAYDRVMGGCGGCGGMEWGWEGGVDYKTRLIRKQGRKAYGLIIDVVGLA